jgi:hypothetical protein
MLLKPEQLNFKTAFLLSYKLRHEMQFSEILISEETETKTLQKKQKILNYIVNFTGGMNYIINEIQIPLALKETETPF